MSYILIFIIGAGWGIVIGSCLIIHDLATLDKHVHKGDETDLTINDFINFDTAPKYEK